MSVFDRIAETVKGKVVRAKDVRAYRFQKEHPELAYIATGKKTTEFNPMLEKEAEALKHRQKLKTIQIKNLAKKSIDTGGKALQKFAAYEKKHGEEVKKRYGNTFKPMKPPKFNY